MTQPCTEHKECISKAMREGERVCQDNDQRFTAVRRRVLEIIWETHKPIKAYDILEKLSDSAGKPPTVYRALNFLLGNGLVHKINTLNAYIGCTHPREHAQCFFIICKVCGTATECCNSALNGIIQETAKKHNFTNYTASLEIQGVCEACANSPPS
ncbi:MAG TPA: Fur family transcriptional regulator [Gammaproteobacteria bacterium]|nr:Fur family transcriptional regulator [Gammaproteobacteria bacterium]